MLPVFFGLAGPALSADERAFFRAADPAGYILFGRNCVSPEQLRALTDDLRSLAGRGRLAILIDQEGGRVARLRPPHWQAHPAAGELGALYQRHAQAGLEAARLTGQALAADLGLMGVNVDCTPVLDVRQPDGAAVVGDRAFSDAPDAVAALGRALAEGLLAGGVLPVIKHMPGHGRALVDSHQALPRVTAPADQLRAVDFAPFKALADLPMAMTAHIVYDALDAQHCATFSPHVIGTVMRGDIGFNGLLMSDDLSMGALSGPIERRAQRALAAGCDIASHCNGDLSEMNAIAAAAPAITAAALARLAAALAMCVPPAAQHDAASLTRARDALLTAH